MAMDESKDKCERRCPRMGHTVSFKYCREFGGEAGACFKLADCWWESFDIVRYIQDNFSEDMAQNLMRATPAPKTSQLVALIEQARSRLKD